MDGELTGRVQSEVVAHLAHCVRCRKRIADWRAAVNALRIAPVPELPSDLYERISDRVAAGERVILPMADPGPVPARASMLPYTGLAAAMVLIALAVVFGTPHARADASELSFFPDKPVAGAVVRVEYQPSSVLAAHERLMLRVRYRTPTSQPYHEEEVVATELRRNRNGRFHGSLQLPDSAVFAIFAVEDQDGSVVDSRSQRGWELLVYSDVGQPTLDALVQQMNDLYGRNWEVAHAIAREAVRLYPDVPRAWGKLHFFDTNVHGTSGGDSIRSYHSGHLMRLHEMLDDPEAGAENASGLAHYAQALESDLAELWKVRLLRQHPRSAAAVQFRTVDVLLRNQADPAGVLRELEALWQDAGPAHELMITVGLQSARRVGDADAFLRWADRVHHFKRLDGYRVARDMLEMPALRDEGVRRIRAYLAQLESGDDAGRTLFRSVPDHDAAVAGRIRSTLAVLGGALLADGDTVAAMRAFDRAVAGGWSPQLFRDVAATRLAAGDSLGSLHLWALVAADPLTSATFDDSVRVRLAHAFDDQVWRTALDSGRDRMRGAVLAGSIARQIRSRVRLVGSAGMTSDLAALADGMPTVMVFWSRFCGPALEVAPLIQQVADRLARRGGRMILIVDEKPGEELNTRLVELGLRLPVYHDAHGEAARALGVWGTPAYIVLDGTGRVRFDHAALGSIERQLSVIGESNTASPQ